MGRFDILRDIERLDPERDHQRIMHLSFGFEFPWDSVRALEIALYRTYCIPSISGLLDRTGEFHRHAQRRYDDTAILIAEMCEHGYEGGQGKEALEGMNWAHGHFKIANDDFLYVLSTFIYEPVRWIDRYAWATTSADSDRRDSSRLSGARERRTRPSAARQRTCAGAFEAPGRHAFAITRSISGTAS